MSNLVKESTNSILNSDWVADIIQKAIKESIVKTIKETIENNVKECLSQKKFTKQMRLVCEKVIKGNFTPENKTSADESEETVNEE